MVERQPPHDHPDAGEAASNADEKILQAEDLFAGRREILIEHAGVRYCLQITRRNRLILRK